MRKIVYEFNSLGVYQTNESTLFSDDKEMKIVLKPHDFSISVGGEVLRKSFCEGYEIVVTNEGKTTFYDNNKKIIATSEKGEKGYKAVHIDWKPNIIFVKYGGLQTVDYYPNCDGEYDRWGEEWVTERLVTLDLDKNFLNEE